MCTQHTFITEHRKDIPQLSPMPPGMALIVTLRGSNYRCLEQIFMVPKGFEPSKFDCRHVFVMKCQQMAFWNILEYFSHKTGFYFA